MVTKRDTPVIGGRKIGKVFDRRKSKGLDFIAKNLFFWCQARALVLEEEYRFHPERKWRFDWAFFIPLQGKEPLKVAIEFEGGTFQANTSHNSPRTMASDANKYNAAAGMGWIVLRFTALNYPTLLAELNKLI